MSIQPERTIESIRLSDWGKVVPAVGVVPWLVEDAEGHPVEPIHRFLRDFVARGRSPRSVRSYAYALTRWWRFLLAVEVPWDQATSAEARDFVLWLGQAVKPRTAPRTRSLTTVGSVNPITRKRYLDDGYGARTIRHSNAVLRAFYDFWVEEAGTLLVNPVPRERDGGRRANRGHNPLEPFRSEGRLRYNPPLPKRRPRAMPDQRWLELFAAMRSNRDRAILALAISNAARASELLGIRGVDIDWGDQLVQVQRKGSRAWQWLPASPEAFVWLRLYFTEIGPIGADEPVWRTLRRRGTGRDRQRSPLTYDALRAMLRRANALLGTNWTMHDLRHTCALRMVRDKRLSLRDVQFILGHAHLTTTQEYLDEDDEQVIARVMEYLADRDQPRPAAPSPAAGYAEADLTVLFGGVQ